MISNRLIEISRETLEAGLEALDDLQKQTFLNKFGPVEKIIYVDLTDAMAHLREVINAKLSSD